MNKGGFCHDYLVEKYGLSIDMVRYRIKIAKQKLKEYIILHENE